MVCWGLFTDAVIERKERAKVEKGILASHICQFCRSNLDEIFRAQKLQSSAHSSYNSSEQEATALVRFTFCS